MPYLTETDFNAPCGELNRAITKLLIKPDNYFTTDLSALIKKYIHDQKPRYETFNNVIGALECAKLEYKRRVMMFNEDLVACINAEKERLYDEQIAPYEDKKIAEHGDIYA